jgi:hypothetical protein
MEMQPLTMIQIGEAMDETLVDMAQHLMIKLRQQLADVVETCNRAGIDGQDVIKMAMGVHLSELLRAAHALDLDEEGFLKMCREAYRGWEKIHGGANDRDG